MWTECSTLSSVRINGTHHQDSPGEIINCQNLILTAGAFTTGIFEKLFKDNVLKPENHEQSAHWFHIALDDVHPEDDVGLRFPQGVKAEARYQSEVRVALRTEDNVLAVSAMDKETVNADLDRTVAISPRRSKTSELRNISTQLLSGQRVDPTDGKQLRRKGRSELSVGNGGNPVIDKVSTLDLAVSSDEEGEDDSPCGIWLCYGFGRHGTLLAPGAAQTLVSKIFGRAAEQDDRESLFSKDIKPNAIGKGKGKAKEW